MGAAAVIAASVLNPVQSVCWPLVADADDTRAKNHMTASGAGASFVADGVYGAVAQTNGTDYFQKTSGVSAPGWGRTIVLRVYPTQNTGNRSIYCEGNAGDDEGLIIYHTNQQVAIAVTDVAHGDAYAISGSGDLTLNAWQTLVCTLPASDPATWGLWRNGTSILNSSGGATNVVWPTMTKTAIGYSFRAPGVLVKFAGKTSFVRVYNFVFSAAQIAAAR